jgi:hypothetical protein
MNNPANLKEFLRYLGLPPRPYVEIIDELSHYYDKQRYEDT